MREKSVSLLYPPSLFLDNPREQPPLGLMYIAAVLEKAGITPTFHDWSGIKDWRKHVDDFYDDVIGCYCVYPHFNFVKYLHEELKKRGKKLIVGGADPSGHPNDYLDRADAVIAGEGERSVFDALKHLETSFSPKVFKTPNIPNLDSIPWPLREFEGFDIRNYIQHFNERRITTAMFSRGCYAGCKFCNSKSIWGRQVRQRSASDCVAEVRFIRDNYGFKAFFPEDDTFNWDNKWVMDFCNQIKNDDFIWRCLTRAGNLTPEVLSSMRYSGCQRVSIGVESGSNKILRNINKGETAEQQLRGIKAAKAVMEVQAFIILGLPGETRETLQETKKFMEEAMPDYFDLTLLRVFPDSDIMLEKDKLDIQILDFDPEASWYKGGIPQSCVRTSALSKEDLENAYKELYDHFIKLGIKQKVGHYINPNQYPEIKDSLR